MCGKRWLDISAIHCVSYSWCQICTAGLHCLRPNTMSKAPQYPNTAYYNKVNIIDCCCGNLCMRFAASVTQPQIITDAMIAYAVSAGKRQVDLPSSAAVDANKGEDRHQDSDQMMTADSSHPHGSGKRTESAPKGQVRYTVV